MNRSSQKQFLFDKKHTYTSIPMPWRTGWAHHGGWPFSLSCRLRVHM